MGTIQDYVKACVDASPAVVQGMAYAAAIKGQTYSAYVKKTYGGGKRDSSKPTCFKCERTGHIQKMCRGKNKQERSRKGPTPGICPRCEKGRHSKSECRSKFHKDGTALTEIKEKKSENETKN